MKVLLIGNGGREHALAWRLAQSPSVARVVCPNGNPGIGEVAEVPEVPMRDAVAWATYAAENSFDLVVVGPEAPLAAGVVDECLARGVKAFGPTKAAAQLEASKAFAKEVMLAAGVPTARAQAFESIEPARAFARELGLPVVIKADGLAAGKGVIICESDAHVDESLHDILGAGRFGASGARVLVEEFLVGEEASLLAFCDGKDVVPMAPSQDHKRALDGDLGPNTGGMGAYAPAPVVTEEVLAGALGGVFRPVMAEMARRGTPYTGVLYAGLMLTADGPRVLEFNCRFGDPEAQVVLPLLDGDLGEILLACAEGRLASLTMPGGRTSIGTRPGSCACVVAASGGYPGDYDTGKVIRGLDKARGHDRIVFHAGTRRAQDGSVVTAGGRVLGMTAWASDLRSALDAAYGLVDAVHFDGMFCRRDIAHRALARRSQP